MWIRRHPGFSLALIFISIVGFLPGPVAIFRLTGKAMIYILVNDLKTVPSVRRLCPCVRQYLFVYIRCY